LTKITFERFDFANGTVEKREREIDSREVLANNALFQSLFKRAARGGPDLTHAPTAKLFQEPSEQTS
jgi:hypothetical protein